MSDGVGMSRTTISLLPVAKRAYEAAQRVFADYSHVYSPKKYTQPQLAALLIVRQRMNWTYRRTVAHVAEWSDLREVLELETVPDHSTLAVFHHRKLDEKSWNRFLKQALMPPADAE